MIRIDFAGKLKARQWDETVYLEHYWTTVNYRREPFAVTYGGQDFPLAGDLDEVLKPFLALNDSDPLQACLNLIDETLADDSGTSLARRLLLATPDQIAALAAHPTLRALVNTAVPPTRAGDKETYPVKEALTGIFAYQNGTYANKIATCLMLLDWRVCLYCGRNHLSQIHYETADGRQKMKRGYQLDHFNDKSAHPYLALTLRNLIPACSFCNAVLKGTESVGTLSPWSPKYNFHREVKFRLANDPALMTPEKHGDDASSPTAKPETTEKSSDAEDCAQEQTKVQKAAEQSQTPRLLLARRAGNPYEDLIRVLRLEASYQLHAEEALAIAQKRACYPDEHIRELAEIAGLDLQTMKRHLFEAQWHEATSDRHPLSKLSREIHTHLKIPPTKANKSRL